MNCRVCSSVLSRVMDLVKDGTVYQAFRCAAGHHLVKDTLQDHLPVELETQDGVQVARVNCGENCYIFDRRMFRAALRRVIRECRRPSRDLVLDLSRISLVGDGLLSAIRFLDNGLRKRQRNLFVVAASAAVESHLLSAVPRLLGRIYRKEAEAFAASGRLASHVEGDVAAVASPA